MERKVEIREVLDVGDDVLLVRGTVEGVTQTVTQPLLDAKGKQRTRGRGASKEPIFERVEEPIVVEARGWVSALENHYPPEAYDDAGALRLKSTRKGAPGDPQHEPRPMSPAERRAYAEQLLRDRVERELAATATPVTL